MNESHLPEFELPPKTIKLREDILNGKKIGYSSETVFLVQVGKDSKSGRRGSYRTRFSTTGNLAQAVIYYNSINIGNGYKKRLLCPAMNKPVLAREFSQ